jgi:hypothetical protein
MTHWWSASWRRGVAKAWASRANLRVEHLEARTLLTASLVVVPSPIVTGGTLFGTGAIAHNDIWAVGDYETLNPQDQIVFQTLAEHFDGSSWSVIPTPSFLNGGELLSIAGVATNDVWAVGAEFSTFSYASSLIEHWDGTSWSVAASGILSGAHLTGVTAVSSNNVFAVGGDAGNNALVEHWNGTSWSQVSSSAFNNVGSLTAVSADASNDIWAIGCCGPIGTGQAILHSDGTNWSLVSSHPRFGPLAITALSPSNVWVAGTVEDSDNDSPIAAVEHWDGTSWSIVPSPNPNPGKDKNSHLLGVAAISASDIWAVGDIGAPFGHIATLTEHWDGTSWSVITSPNPGSTSNRLYGVTALSDGTVAAVGNQQGSSLDSGLILRNPGSSPKTAGPLGASVPASAATNAPATATMPAAPLRAAVVDQWFALLSTTNQASSFAGHGSWLQMADNGELDALGGTIWLWDRA